jgi:hypothetical protein
LIQYVSIAEINLFPLTVKNSQTTKFTEKTLDKGGRKGSTRGLDPTILDDDDDDDDTGSFYDTDYRPTYEKSTAVRVSV